MTKTLVDSNILVYFSQHEEEDKHAICAKRIKELVENDDMYISVQNLAEFSRVITEKSKKKRSSDEANEFVEKFSKFSHVITYTSSTIILANKIAKENKLHFFDALLVATMKENSINHVLTENTDDFNKISGINAINPFEK
jgi:predicted nucleic acid-binding protein